MWCSEAAAGRAVSPVPAAGVRAPRCCHRRRAVPGIDVLAEQRDLAAPCPTSRRASAITAAAGRLVSAPRCVGHDTEAAEPVAALLDRQKGGDSLRRRRVRQEVELVLGRKIGLDHRAAGPGRARHHFRQPVIGLRPSTISTYGARVQDVRALGLGDAAGNRQDHPPALRARCSFSRRRRPSSENTFSAALSRNVAGVEDDHVGAVRHRRRHKAEWRQHIGHPPTVVHVHLAAPGDDVQTPRASLHSAHRRGEVIKPIGRVKRCCSGSSPGRAVGCQE